jgi:tetratricopeptide (TPR) repeat protein
MYRRQERYEEAEPLAVEAVNRYRRVRGEDHQDTLGATNNLAELYRTLGRYDEAEPLYLEVLQAQMRLNPVHPNAGIYSHNLACIYRDTQRFEESIRLFEQAQQIWGASLPPEHPFFIENYTQWAELLRQIGDKSGAEQMEARAKAIGDKR